MQPFQDIAVGGIAIPGQEPGYLAVWAVTFHGKVSFTSVVFSSRNILDGLRYQPPFRTVHARIAVALSFFL